MKNFWLKELWGARCALFACCSEPHRSQITRKRSSKATVTNCCFSDAALQVTRDIFLFFLKFIDNLEAPVTTLLILNPNVGPLPAHPAPPLILNTANVGPMIVIQYSQGVPIHPGPRSAAADFCSLLQKS